MARSLRFQGCLLAVTFFAANLPAFNQAIVRPDTPVRYPQHTVSVATLLVSEKAWQHLEKAVAAGLAHRDPECEREIAKALEVTPRFPQAYLLRAMRDLTAKRFESAIENVLAAQRIDSTTTWAGTILAGANNGLHRFHDALLVLDSMRGPEAEAWQYAYERTRALLGTRDAVGALHWSAIALQIAPKARMDVHLLRINALNLAGRTPEAVTEMEAYVSMPGAQEHRAEVLALLATLKQQSDAETLPTIASR